MARRQAKRSTKSREVTPAQFAQIMGVPDAQIANSQFEIVDVKNTNDNDLRHMVRSGIKKTVRRKTKLEKLYPAVLTLDGYKACRWLQDAHSLGYDTVGITANYSGGTGCGNRSFSHLASHMEQATARAAYAFAREGVDSILRPLLEKVVIHGRPIGRLNLSFRRAVDQLISRAETAGAL